MGEENFGDVELSERRPLLSAQEPLSSAGKQLPSTSMSSEPGSLLLIRLRLIAYLASELAQTCSPDRVCNVVSDYLLKQYSEPELKMCADGVSQFPNIDPVAKLTHHCVAGLFDVALRAKSRVPPLSQPVRHAIRCV